MSRLGKTFVRTQLDKRYALDKIDGLGISSGEATGISDPASGTSSLDLTQITGVESRNILVLNPPSSNWLGQGNDREFGAIAKNDFWSTTTYDYQRTLAPTIPTIPEPTTGVNPLPTSNGVNPNAGDEYFLFTWDASVVNNAAYRVVFFCKGLNASNAAWEVISSGGSAATPRWFVYHDPANPSAVQDIKPWNLASTDRARVTRMTQNSADWIYFVGLDFGDNGFGRTQGSDNVTFYRCMADGFTIHCCGPSSLRSDNLTIFECLGRNSVSTVDAAFVAFTAASTGTKVISCEAYNIAGDMVVVDQGATVDGLDVEDCDYYYTLFTNGNGVEVSNPSLTHCRGEGFVDIKKSNGLAGQKNRIYGNRVYRMRLTDPVLHPDSGSATPVRASVTTIPKALFDIKYNVFHDCNTEGISLIDGAHLGDGHHTIAYNLLENFWGSGDIFWPSTDNTEVYLNTVANTASAGFLFNFARFTTPFTVPSFDCIGNNFINTAAAGMNSETQLDVNSVFNYSAYVGSGEQYEKGQQNTNYVNASLAAMNFGNFTYLAQKLTGPVTRTINSVVPTSLTPNAFLTGANTDIGTRTGIGVDNTVYRTTQVQPSATWLLDNVTTEFGAIAVNDDWANTIYEYTPTLAPTIPTIPTPTGDVSAITTSQVNPNAADEYLVFDLTGFLACMNDNTYTYVFIAKGTDLYGGYNVTRTIDASGTGSVGTPRWFVWWDPDVPANGLDPKPWEQGSADRVYMPFQTRMDNSHYIYWVGLCYGKVDNVETAAGARMHAGIRWFNGASNHTMYRCLEEYCGGCELADGAKSRNQWDAALAASGRITWTSFQAYPTKPGSYTASGDNHMFYQCVFRKGCKFGEERDQLSFRGGSGHRVVSCEFSDSNNAVGVGEGWGGTDVIFEDCDFYKTRWSVSANTADGVATLDPNGLYTSGDAGTGVKSTGTPTAGNISLGYYGCRFYHHGPGSYALDLTPTSGIAFVCSSEAGSNTYQTKIDMRKNIFYDMDISAMDFFASNPTSLNGNYGDFHSIVGNLISNIRATPMNINEDQIEMYLNTFADTEGSGIFYAYVFPDDTLFEDFDCKGNAFLNTNSLFWTASSAESRFSGHQSGYNAYADSSPPYNVTYGGDYQAVSRAALNLGDFKYYRNKLTGPILTTIPGVVPTSATPASFRTGANVNIGDRTGIGIDDVSVRTAV